MDIINKLNITEKINVLISFGTRPEGIKLAPVIKCINKQSNKFNLKVCSTGQHKEMLKQVLNFFKIKTDFDLNLMTENQSLSSFSSRLLNKVDKIIADAKPDIVLIQGDTTSALLIALSAFYRKIMVGHIEAGLRTYDRNNPFPEEINRQLISRVADLHFAPTKSTFNNLLAERVDKNNIFLTGNTIVDAINWGIEKIKMSSIEEIESSKPFSSLNSRDKIILVTMHRRESFGSDIKNVCKALKIISKKYSDIKIVYPVHFNPNVTNPVFEILSGAKNILLTEPLNYQSFIWLMNKSYFIITDSGGVQEEAPAFKKPVLVIRKKTERTESVDLGISKLVGTDTNSIVDDVSNLLYN
ncbi:MAG: UDP-N-acetylglucosamine 2-epimerase (non-hydrolyzing), partial [Parcubacteria group bacterium]|nr:UDP-N-acetylglucosamine 2-epimerase (non-hydrolyzing) [Parcubacteria group bacterium]